MKERTGAEKRRKKCMYVCVCGGREKERERGGGGGGGGGEREIKCLFFFKCCL